MRPIPSFIGFFLQPLRAYGRLFAETLAAIDSLESRPDISLTLKTKLALWLVVLWGFYLPLHEMFHALGCLIGGGEVWEIELSVWSGGGILGSVFPLFKPVSSFGGRLSGYSTGGSDWVYLLTDIFPYFPTMVFGTYLLRRGSSPPRPPVLALGMILALAPFISLPGDYYEMGSILVSDLARWILSADGTGDWVKSIDLIRSDDIISLSSQILQKNVEPASAGRGTAFLLVFFSLCVGIWLAGGTFWMSERSASWISPLPNPNRK